MGVKQSHESVFQMEANLGKALERRELQLYYQPKLELNTGKIQGVEALLRWIHPEKGLIPPLDFIPLAEETGLIIPIGEWVIRTACEQGKRWSDMGLPPFVISVNLSVCQFSDPNLAETVRGIFEETGFSPEYLEIEITENIMMNGPLVFSVLRDLKQLGVQISLDDFGTGFSSLYSLKECPVDKIKIDQSFVCNCIVDSKDAAMIKAIIAMSRQLEIDVIAEGIESEEQLVFLQQNLCKQGQGYFFSKPMPSTEFTIHFAKMDGILKQSVITQELNKQKWLEQELKKARQELRDTVKQQQGMIFKIKKVDGRFIHTLCDGELLFRMGLTSELVVGKELFDFSPRSLAEEKTKCYQRAWDGEENVQYEGKINGIWYLASLRPIRRNGEVVEVIGSGVDITEKKIIEHRLMESESKYRIIAENTQDLIRVLDTNFFIKYASPSHEMILGLSPDEYEGNSVYKFYHPDDVPIVQEKFKQMASTKSPCQVEYHNQHLNGSWVHIEGFTTPVLNETGEIEYFVVVGRDISDRKRTEEQILKSEKLSVVGQLASSIAHEIRNPLTSVKGFVQILQKEREKLFYTQIILSEIKKIETILEEFLAFAKHHKHQRKEISMNSLLQKVLHLFCSQTKMNNIKLIQEYSSIPSIYCDENLMKQVFMNILQNAVDAMPNGGKIKVLTHKHDSSHIKIQFIDNGVGMPEERIKNIGEPFYSLKEKGTGLGLMVCNKIVLEHEGTINIQSMINQGTTVDLILPIGKPVTAENGTRNL